MAARHRATRRTTTLLLVTVVAAASPVRARDSGGPRASPRPAGRSAGSPPASSEGDPEAELSRRHTAAATDAEAAHDFGRALAELEAAQRLRPGPAIEFRIARCHDRLGQLDEAIASYGRYLAARPEPVDAEEVRERIRILKARPRVLEPAPPPAPPHDLRPPPQTAPPAPPHDLRPPPQTAPPDAAPRPLPLATPPTRPPEPPPIALPREPVAPRESARAAPAPSYAAPILVGATAVAQALVGVALFASARSDADALGASDPSSSRALAGDLLLGAAAVATLVDIVLWALAARRPAPPRPR